MSVRITFKYDPEEPDEKDSTGMSEQEYIRLNEQIAQLGGYDLELEVVEE